MKSHSRDLFSHLDREFQTCLFYKVDYLSAKRSKRARLLGRRVYREREREKDFGTWLPRNDRFNELLDFAAVYRGRGLSTTIHVPFHISLYPSETEHDRG